MAEDKENKSELPINRVPLSDKITKLTESIRIHLKKPYQQPEGTEVSQVMDQGKVIGHYTKVDGKIISSQASPDMQMTGEDDKAAKKVGAKKGDWTKTVPTAAAEATKDEKQVTPAREKEHKVQESEGKERIKAPDSKEKKTPEKPKEAKKPDTSMSKMASGESAKTQGAAPLAKNYNVTRTPPTKDTPATLNYSRIGEKKNPKAPGPQSNAPVVPSAAGRAVISPQPQPVAASTGPNEPTKADPIDKGPKPNSAGAPAVAPVKPKATGGVNPGLVAPNSKDKGAVPRWKALFQQRKSEKDQALARKLGPNKAYTSSKGEVFVKSEREEFEPTPGNKKRAKDEAWEDAKDQARKDNESGKPLAKGASSPLAREKSAPTLGEPTLKKDVVDFKKPTGKPKEKTAPAKSGVDGMFDVLKRGKSQLRPGNSDQKIKAALEAQKGTNPYATAGHSAGVGTTPKRGNQIPEKAKAALDKQRGTFIDRVKSKPSAADRGADRDMALVSARDMKVQHPMKDTRDAGFIARLKSQTDALEAKKAGSNVRSIGPGGGQISAKDFGPVSESPTNPGTHMVQATGGALGQRKAGDGSSKTWYYFNHNPKNGMYEGDAGSKSDEALHREIFDKVVKPSLAKHPRHKDGSEPKYLGITNRNMAVDEGKPNPYFHGEDYKESTAAPAPIEPITKPGKPQLVKDLGRMKNHTQSGRPFRVSMATHEDHAELPGYHFGLNEHHNLGKARAALADPTSEVNKAVVSAVQKGHDHLYLHNPKPKAGK